MTPEQEPTPPENKEIDYAARGLKGLSLVMGGLAVYLSGFQGPQTTIEAAHIITGAGLLGIGVGSYITIDSALRDKDQDNK